MATFVKSWKLYIKERFPPLTYLLLSSGFAFSSVVLAEGMIKWQPIVRALMQVLLFFFCLRLMDELKDYEKDVLAHPERPLPSGLLAKEHVQKVIVFLVFLMAFFALLTQSSAYFVVTIWLWLMFKEFYIGEKLSRSPFLYAVTHQLILIPLVFSCASEITLPVLGYAVSVLGAFFTYEICRKLDPKAHPILKTYLSHYGYQKTFLLIFLTTFIAAVGAFILDAQWLWIFEILTLILFGSLLRKPFDFKKVEHAATLSLLAHLYAGLVVFLLK